MTESERATLQLAPGSRWESSVRYRHAVIEENGMRVWVTPAGDLGPTFPVVSAQAIDRVTMTFAISDVLAIIRAAGLDPEYAELVRLRESIELATEGYGKQAYELYCKACDSVDEEKGIRLGARSVALDECAESLRKLVKP